MVLWSKQGASFWFTNLFSICCHFVLYLNAEGINEDTEGKKTILDISISTAELHGGWSLQDLNVSSSLTQLFIQKIVLSKGHL